MKYVLTRMFVLLYYFTKIYGARILCAFPAPSVSHQVIFQPIWRELSLRGHQVTVLTPNPLKDPTLTNLREIDLSKLYEVAHKFSYQSSFSPSLSLNSITSSFYYMYSIVVRAELNNPEVLDLIANQDIQFDLLLVQYNLPTLHALSERFKCPMVGISVSGLFFMGFDIIGNSPHLALNPDVQMPFRDNLRFFDRLRSILYTTWHRYHYYNTVVPKEDAVARQFIKQDTYLGEISSNVSLLLFNANPFTYTVRATLPSLIDLDNLYEKNNKSLPQDLQDELDKAKQGFVYFSLGSNLRSANISLNVREKILECFSELSYKVLWKWEDDYLPGKPNNVIIRKWFPQTDILAHPNIKVFIMQGGIQSIDEAIAFTVPIIAMPIYLDQFSNTEKIVNLGIAKSVDIFQATKAEMKAAIIEVAENPIFKKRIRSVQSLISDVPIRGLEKTIWWIEYVMRHKGVPFLKSPVISLRWYQECLIDVVGCILITICAIMLTVFKIFKIFL